MTSHDGGLEVRETFKIAHEFAPDVTITDKTFFSHGWQPLTISVLQSLWFLPADATFDVPFLVDWYTQLGWKGANGKPLGAPVVRREIGLIREAGYIRSTRLRGEGGRAVGIQYTISRRQSDQKQDEPWLPVVSGVTENRSSGHVRPMPTRGQSPHVANGQKPSSGHVRPMPTRGQSPHVANAAKPQVAPRVANDVPPPLPPGGGTTPPPTPSMHSDGARPHPSQTEEEVVFDETDTAAAVEFLQQLPDPWVIGERDAREMAPKLLTQMRAKDWPDIHTVDRRSLERAITGNPGKMRNPVAILQHRRIPNLSYYGRIAAKVAAAAAADDRCPEHPQYRAGSRCVLCVMA